MKKLSIILNILMFLVCAYEYLWIQTALNDVQFIRKDNNFLEKRYHEIRHEKEWLEIKIKNNLP